MQGLNLSNYLNNKVKEKVNVLDSGFVRLVDYMGDDAAVVQAARVSYNEESKGKEQDDKLIRYLIKNEHWTPVEMIVFKFHISCPIFIARQWMRHRASSYNEISGRYVELDEQFYFPAELRAPANYSKQGSGAPELAVLKEKGYSVDQFADEKEWNDHGIDILEDTYKYVYYAYKELINMGVAKEIARAVLPVGTYTQFYWKIDCRNLFNFLKLRLDSHAQWEIQQYANVIVDIVQKICPVTYSAFEEYLLKG